MYRPAGISVVICSHNPAPEILQRCLASIRAQTDVPAGSELLLVDNVSTPRLQLPPEFQAGMPFESTRVVREEKLGLSHARRRALQEAKGEVVVFVDDDNVLNPDYLAVTAKFFAENSRAGAAGGRSRGGFDGPPPVWIDAAAPYLAITNPGPRAFRHVEPGWWAPAGAGLAVRREPALRVFELPFWLVDRQGQSLSSGGDAELCYRICDLGFELCYVPELLLEHWIPARRLAPEYLIRLAQGIGQSLAVLDLYRLPQHLRTPWYLFRRAFYTWRLGLAQKWLRLRSHDETVRMEAALKAAHLSAQARALLRLVFQLKRFEPEDRLRNRPEPLPGEKT